MLAPLFLAACELGETLPVQGIFQDSGVVGGAAADEPRAALVARDILVAGGSAADAAVALYFTLAVTYPSTASLGGGGQCLVYAPGEDDDTVETLEFLPGLSRVSARGATRPSAVPGSVRGMYALQSRYGRLRWGQLLVPAENFARFGHPASRALVRDLSLAADQLFADPLMRATFAAADGGAIEEGRTVSQLDLGAVISKLRIRGAGDFYSGDVARQLVAAAERVGGTLSLDDLRDYKPRWTTTVSLPFGSHEIHTAPAPAVGGVTVAAIFSLGAEDDRYADAAPDERAHLLAEITMRAYADRSAWLETGEAPLDPERLERSMASYRADVRTPADALSPRPSIRLENPAAASFVVVDGSGMGVACTVTMNNLFGTGQVAPGTGIVLAAAPDARIPISFAPVLMVNRVNRQLLFAGASVGGAAASSALATVMLEVLTADTPLRSALRVPRLFHGGAPDRVAIEPGIEADARRALADRGHDLIEVPEIGRVNAIHCPGGMPRSPKSCLFESDRRGFGLAASGTL